MEFITDVVQICAIAMTAYMFLLGSIQYERTLLCTLFYVVLGILYLLALICCLKCYFNLSFSILILSCLVVAVLKRWKRVAA